MAQAYTPGLQVTELTRVTKLRELPIVGKVLVKKGERVTAKTPVLSANRLGELDIIRVASRMGLDPTDILEGMRVKVGDKLKAGELLCQIKAFFGLVTLKTESPVSGEVEFFTEANAHLGIRHPPIPLTITAYINGEVTGCVEGKSVTIETEASLIQGIFGVGGERLGTIVALPVNRDAIVEPGDLDVLGELTQNAVLVGGAQFSTEALKHASKLGVSAVVTGSIDSKRLHDFVGFEIGVSITGDEDVPLTLIITEGFGFLPLAARVGDLAVKLNGKSASVNGATQVRAGAMRPEIIVPLADATKPSHVEASVSQSLKVGSHVRIIRVPYFGELAEVTDLPPEPTDVPSGAKVRILKARLKDGSVVIIPRANVELMQ